MQLNNRYKTVLLGFAAVAAAVLCVTLPSCKSCKKKKEETVTAVDTTTTPLTPSGTLTTPHGDSTLIPVFAGILEEAFIAAQKKDYEKLGMLMVYRGPNINRLGQDVFRTKDPDEKAIVRMTGEVLSKWTAGAESIEYPRVFQLQQGDGRNIEMLEVIIIHPKKLDRKFFGFLLIGNSYKIVDVTSYL